MEEAKEIELAQELAREIGAHYPIDHTEFLELIEFGHSIMEQEQIWQTYMNELFLQARFENSGLAWSVWKMLRAPAIYKISAMLRTLKKKKDGVL